MPPKKRRLYTRTEAKKKAEYVRLLRQNEEEDHRRQRLQEDAARHAASRDNETEEERQQRTQHVAELMRSARQEEDEDHRERRLQEDAARHAAVRDNHTEEERQERRQQATARNAKVKAHFNSKAVHTLLEYTNGDSVLPGMLNIGAMDVSCSACNAKMWRRENHVGSVQNSAAKFSTCCAQGKVILPPPSDPPDVLKTLFTASTPESSHFRKNIRAYNSSLAFTSLGVNEQHLNGIKITPLYRYIYHFCYYCNTLIFPFIYICRLSLMIKKINSR